MYHRILVDLQSIFKIKIKLNPVSLISITKYPKPKCIKIWKFCSPLCIFNAYYFKKIVSSWRYLFANSSSLNSFLNIQYFYCPAQCTWPVFYCGTIIDCKYQTGWTILLKSRFVIFFIFQNSSNDKFFTQIKVKSKLLIPFSFSHNFHSFAKCFNSTNM